MMRNRPDSFLSRFIFRKVPESVLVSDQQEPELPTSQRTALKIRQVSEASLPWASNGEQIVQSVRHHIKWA